MELKPNIYVRTKWGYICKIININVFREPSMKYGVEASYLKDIMFIGDDDILKASHNIVDLLEVGDIITTNNLCGEVTHIEGDKIYTTCYDGEYCYDYQIQSILTREQFESMKYEVE